MKKLLLLLVMGQTGLMALPKPKTMSMPTNLPSMLMLNPTSDENQPVNASYDDCVAQCPIANDARI